MPLESEAGSGTRRPTEQSRHVWHHSGMKMEIAKHDLSAFISRAAAGSDSCCTRAVLMVSNFEDTGITSPHFLTIADQKNQRLIGEPLTVTPQPAFNASQLR